MQYQKWITALLALLVILSGINLTATLLGMDEAEQNQYSDDRIEDARILTPEEIEARNAGVSVEEWRANNGAEATYENELFSFSYPATYTVTEHTEMEGFDTGSLLSVSVLNEDDDLVLLAQATSADFAEGIGEGCCYYFSGGLDLSKEIAKIKTDIESQLGEIYVPEKTEIANKPAVEFVYTTSYANTFAKAAHIAPIDHPVYDNVFFIANLKLDIPMEGLDESTKEQFRTASKTEIINALNPDAYETYKSLLETFEWK